MMVFRFLFLLVVFIFSPSAWAGFIDYPTVRLQALDKSTARTVTLEAKVGTTIEYGSIFIKIRACREAEPLDKPESASFLQIWEVPLNAEKSEWVFSGWMFSSSPALSAMDHPVYDVWVLDCIDKDRQNAETQKAQTQTSMADQGDLKEMSDQEVSEKENISDESKPRIVEEDEIEALLGKEVQEAQQEVAHEMKENKAKRDALLNVIAPILEEEVSIEAE